MTHISLSHLRCCNKPHLAIFGTPIATPPPPLLPPSFPIILQIIACDAQVGSGSHSDLDKVYAVSQHNHEDFVNVMAAVASLGNNVVAPFSADE